MARSISQGYIGIRNGHIEMRDTPDDLRAITIRNVQHSPLLRLPVEVQERILGFAVGGHIVQINERAWAYSHEGFYCVVIPRMGNLVKGTPFDRRTKGFLAPLRTCRHFYQLAALMPYTHNLFDLRDDTDFMCRWMEQRKACQTYAIARLAVPDFPIPAVHFNSLKGLKVVYIDGRDLFGDVPGTAEIDPIASQYWSRTGAKIEKYQGAKTLW